MILAHRIALDPTVKQRIAFAKACGVARKAWNWGLNEWNKQYEAGEKPTALKIKKKWNAIKEAEYPWVYESPKDANQQPFTNLGTAFQRFFKKLGNRPDFKRKGEHDSFYVSNDKMSVEGSVVTLPVIGKVRMTEALRFEGKVMSATISRTANRWFISIAVETEVAKFKPNKKAVGTDLGIKTALVLSDGTTYAAPNPLRNRLKKLRRLSKAHSRKKKGSNNRKKSAARLAVFHSRVANIRRDWTHKVTSDVVRKNHTIAIEDLNVQGMTRNHRLARAINDVGFYEIRRQLEYKSKMRGRDLRVIHRFMPTSKTCSNCGCKKEVLSLSERVFHCIDCGFKLDRDLNAARNILAAGLAASACGPEGSGFACKRKTKPAGVKQELPVRSRTK